MATDISVIIVQGVVSDEAAIDAVSKACSSSSNDYLLISDRVVGGKKIRTLSIWLHDETDLIEVSMRMSADLPVLCVLWKVEHGGISGTIRFTEGATPTIEEDDGEFYHRLPVRVFEDTLKTTLEAEHLDEFSFPENLLVGADVYNLSGQKLSRDFRRILFEGDTIADPLLPL